MSRLGPGGDGGAGFVIFVVSVVSVNVTVVVIVGLLTIALVFGYIALITVFIIFRRLNEIEVGQVHRLVGAPNAADSIGFLVRLHFALVTAHESAGANVLQAPDAPTFLFGTAEQLEPHRGRPLHHAVDAPGRRGRGRGAVAPVVALVQAGLHALGQPSARRVPDVPRTDDVGRCQRRAAHPVVRESGTRALRLVPATVRAVATAQESRVGADLDARREHPVDQVLDLERPLIVDAVHARYRQMRFAPGVVVGDQLFPGLRF